LELPRKKRRGRRRKIVLGGGQNEGVIREPSKCSKRKGEEQKEGGDGHRELERLTRIFFRPGGGKTGPRRRKKTQKWKRTDCPKTVIVAEKRNSLEVQAGAEREDRKKGGGWQRDAGVDGGGIWPRGVVYV